MISNVAPPAKSGAGTLRALVAIILLILVVPACWSASNPPKGGLRAAANEGPLDLYGKLVNVFAQSNAVATVMIFVGSECPISNRYAPEIRRLHEKFITRGVRFWVVYSDPDTTAETIRRHVADFNLAGEPLRDPHHVLVRKAKATVTPECAVFTASARLAYHGRIDDRVADFGKERPVPTQHDLQEALESVIAGKKPRSAATPAIGCRIPALP
jgi:hypothetical protein